MKIEFSAERNLRHMIEKKIDEEISLWQQENKLQKLWDCDASLWTYADENQWLGWLNAPHTLGDLPKIEALAEQMQREGFEDIVLLGMGGSSLFPAMLAAIFNNKHIQHIPHLHILDSTDPDEIKNLEEKINIKKTLFIVSSKSGTTLETLFLTNYFHHQVQIALNKKNIGDSFIAITDRHTPLEKLAKQNHFRAVFYGISSIGGRYSALSNFGMVPAGLIRFDIKTFLQLAETMQNACQATPIYDNPGVYLGILLGVCEKLGKNKITFIISPPIQALGAWLEQLLAESLGKCGQGFIPIDQEPLGEPSSYGYDRLFVYIRLDKQPDHEQDIAVHALQEAGFIIIQIHLKDALYLGAEVFRFEIATAVAGSLIGIHPFNQPNVEESKKLTLQLLNKINNPLLYSIPLLFSEDDLSLFTDAKNAKQLTQQLIGSPSIENYLTIYLSQLKQGDYVQLAAFIAMSEDNINLLQKIRVLIRNSKKVATCLGFGPRFLHSTGQAHKGGINCGLFLQITADYANDIPIPLEPHTFGRVIAAQACADFLALSHLSRPILRIHLGEDVQGELRKLYQKIQLALEKKTTRSSA